MVVSGFVRTRLATGRFLCLFLAACSPLVVHATPVISEFMAVNDSILADCDGDCSDWIEIYNPGTNAVDLEDWYLTDNDGNLTKWRFPSETPSLAPGGFLVVFASGKDKVGPGNELHTDFKLGSSGEYLALIHPDGTNVVSSFAPMFPIQVDDVSYGREFLRTPLVANEATLAYRVPQASDAASASQWMQPGYSDLAWSRDPQGFGFSEGAGSFHVRTVRSSLALNNLSNTELALSTPGYQISVETEDIATINYFDTGGAGNFGGDAPFTGIPIGTGADDVAIEATAHVFIPAAGNWTFGVNSDDGFGLVVSNATTTFQIQHDGTRGPGDTLGVFDVPAAGIYELRLVFFERGGGAEVELFAAEGAHSSFSAGTFQLVGDADNGGLALAGFAGVFNTDLKSGMFGVNASLWTRAKFSSPVKSDFEALTLYVEFEDGFQAWLNGTSVAAANNPAALSWNATAVSNRPAPFAAIAVPYALGPGGTLLNEGENTLAVLGLNDDEDDAEFLLRLALEGARMGGTNFYFNTPTPGALTALPSVSLVTDLGNLFNASTGIYVNAGGEGVTWERAEASYGESHFGDDKSDYDIVKVERAAGYTIKATDGTLDAWQSLWTMASAGFSSNADYFRARGLNLDGTPNPAYPKWLDPGNVIDCAIATYYAGDLDGPISNFLGNDRPNNAYILYNRLTPDGFKCFRHDGEHTLLDNNRD